MKKFRKVKRKLGRLFFRITGGTCRWDRNADLDCLLEEIVRQAEKFKSKSQRLDRRIA